VARHRQRPAQPARAGLAQVEAPVDEDPREPHLEGQVLAIAGDVREHLDEGVLHRLVGVVDVAEVLVGDAEGAALLPGHEVAEALACGVTLAGEDEGLDGAGDLRFLGQHRADAARGVGRVGAARLPDHRHRKGGRSGVSAWSVTGITIPWKGFPRRCAPLPCPAAPRAEPTSSG
jgi:hypothetical protein